MRVSVQLGPGYIRVHPAAPGFRIYLGRGYTRALGKQPPDKPFVTVVEGRRLFGFDPPYGALSCLVDLGSSVTVGLKSPDIGVERGSGAWIAGLSLCVGFGPGGRRPK